MSKAIICWTHDERIVVNGSLLDNLDYDAPRWMAIAAVTDVLDAVGYPYEITETAITIPDGWQCHHDGWVRWNPERHNVDRFDSVEAGWQEILELQKKD